MVEYCPATWAKGDNVYLHVNILFSILEAAADKRYGKFTYCNENGKRVCANFWQIANYFAIQL